MICAPLLSERYAHARSKICVYGKKLITRSLFVTGTHFVLASSAASYCSYVSITPLLSPVVPLVYRMLHKSSKLAVLYKSSTLAWCCSSFPRWIKSLKYKVVLSSLLRVTLSSNTIICVREGQWGSTLRALSYWSCSPTNTNRISASLIMNWICCSLLVA